MRYSLTGRKALPMKRPKSPIELDKPAETAGLPVGGGGGRTPSIAGLARLIDDTPEAAPLAEEIPPPSQQNADALLEARVSRVDDAIPQTSAEAPSRSWVERIADSEWTGNQGPREQGRFQWQEQLHQAAENDSISRMAAPVLGLSLAESDHVLAASPRAPSNASPASPQNILLDADALAALATEPSPELDIGGFGDGGDGGDGGE